VLRSCDTSGHVTRDLLRREEITSDELQLLTKTHVRRQGRFYCSSCPLLSYNRPGPTQVSLKREDDATRCCLNRSQEPWLKRCRCPQLPSTTSGRFRDVITSTPSPVRFPVADLNVAPPLSRVERDVRRLLPCSVT